MRYLGQYPDFGLRFFHSFDEQPLAELPTFSHVGEMVCDRSRRLDPHVHDGFEICYVASGHLLRFNTSAQHIIRPGEFFISRPGEAHGGGTDPSYPCHYFSVGFDPHQCPLSSLLPENRRSSGVDPAEETATLSEPAPSDLAIVDEVLQQRVVAGGKGAESIFRRMLHELDSLDRIDGLSRRLTAATIQTHLIEILLLLVKCSRGDAAAETTSHLQPHLRSAFQDLVRWLPTRLSTPPTLSDMARRVGLSAPHFCIAFKREMGDNPVAYLIGLRIAEAARRLAEDDAPISDVASSLGFHSGQYFSYVFKKLKQCTPSQWRMKHRAA